MNSQLIKRLAEAGKYQKMAVQALLPEGAQKHVDVIANELKAIIRECVFESEIKTETKTETKTDTETKTEKTGGARKIEID